MLRACGEPLHGTTIEAVRGRSEARGGGAVRSGAHLARSRGPHVGKIQIALNRLDNAKIAAPELEATLYGKSTTDAVLGFKKKRSIINFSYQSSADNIVGKMTMATLDREVALAEKVTTNPIIVPLDPPPSPIRPNLFVAARGRGLTNLALRRRHRASPPSVCSTTGRVF